MSSGIIITGSHRIHILFQSITAFQSSSHMVILTPILPIYWPFEATLPFISFPSEQTSLEEQCPHFSSLFCLGLTPVFTLMAPLKLHSSRSSMTFNITQSTGCLSSLPLLTWQQRLMDFTALSFGSQDALFFNPALWSLLLHPSCWLLFLLIFDIGVSQSSVLGLLYPHRLGDLIHSPGLKTRGSSPEYLMARLIVHLDMQWASHTGHPMVSRLSQQQLHSFTCPSPNLGLILFSHLAYTTLGPVTDPASSQDSAVSPPQQWLPWFLLLELPPLFPFCVFSTWQQDDCENVNLITSLLRLSSPGAFHFT